jgi:FKBP-type peptidyl-prolyl cis-trans isomerase (trigger factor)
MGLKSIPCPLDDTLATKCGVENLGVVTDSVRLIAENHLKGERNAKIANQIRLRLLADNDFVLPNWLVNKEAEYMAQHQGVKYPELNDEAKEHLRQQAHDSVKFTLIMDSIRRAEPDTELSDTEALEAVKQTLTQRGVQDTDSFLQKSAREGTLMGFVERIRTDYAVQWLIDNAKVVE